jgi:chemotaxis protein MotB
MSSTSRGRRRAPRPEYWPAFVDVLTNLLLVFIFLISLFALVQFFLGQELSGKDTMLSQLRAQLAQLSAMLSLGREDNATLTANIASLKIDLANAEAEKTRLQGVVDAQAAAIGNANAVSAQLDEQKKVSSDALAQVELLNQQIAALREQLAAIQAALDASEAKNKDAEVKIADLGSRLNIALAQRVRDLERYRSDFFGKLRDILGNRPGVRIVGDRFVFQSEVLFPSGSDQLNPDGQAEIVKLAGALLDLDKQIPKDIAWVMRVDGHTDKRPITNSRFKSNWELSAARAIAVVQLLISKGVPPNRLVAAGFAENQPLEQGDSEEILARNRRIELKITER